jgi:SAM-dependent methyltransferase
MNLKITTEEIQIRLSQLIKERPEVETLMYIMGGEKLEEWAHSAGLVSDPVLRDIAPPIPPYSLRSIVAAPTESVFLWSGFKDAQIFSQLFAKYYDGIKEDAIEVLDFGCGCGRTTRFLQSIESFKVYGSDVNSDLVDWCANNLTRVKTGLNRVMPPFVYEAEKFDFIYSLSIFTHLSERAMDAWLDELERVTDKNGIVMLTVHGATAINTICKSKPHQEMFCMSEDEVNNLQIEFEKIEFYYKKYESNVIAAANAGSDYGNTFITEGYIKREWTKKGFEVLKIIPGGMRGWQDIVILKRSL